MRKSYWEILGLAILVAIVLTYVWYATPKPVAEESEVQVGTLELQPSPLAPTSGPPDDFPLPTEPPPSF